MSNNIKIYDLKKNVLFEDKDITFQHEEGELDEFIKQAKEMVKTKTYQYNSGYQKPAGTPYNPLPAVKTDDKKDDKKDAGKKEKPRTRIGAGWAGTNPPGQSSFYDDEDDYYDRLYGGGFRY